MGEPHLPLTLAIIHGAQLALAEWPGQEATFWLGTWTPIMSSSAGMANLAGKDGLASLAGQACLASLAGMADLATLVWPASLGFLAGPSGCPGRLNKQN